MSSSIPTVVLGASGYVGGELLRLIAAHPRFGLAAAVSDSRAGSSIGDTFAHLSQALNGVSFVGHDDWLDRIEPDSDLALFSAAPHGRTARSVRGRHRKCSRRRR
jgi:N-acetyl-gamma-glutamylphosphate reductase